MEISGDIYAVRVLIHLTLSIMNSLLILYLRALQHAVVGCGSNFEPFITTDLLQLIFTSLGHANRFVRETGFKVISSIVQCPGLSKATTDTHWPVVAENLARGLADNWSQVWCRVMYTLIIPNILSNICGSKTICECLLYTTS